MVCLGCLRYVTQIQHFFLLFFFRHRKFNRGEEQQPLDVVRVADATPDLGSRPRHPMVPGAQLHVRCHSTGLRVVSEIGVSFQPISKPTCQTPFTNALTAMCCTLVVLMMAGSNQFKYSQSSCRTLLMYKCVKGPFNYYVILFGTFLNDISNSYQP